jgi:hypothetical protein
MNNIRVYENLKMQAMEYANKGQATNATYTMKLARYVGALKELDFSRVTSHKNGHMNMGDIVEVVMCEYLGITKEDDLHEIKSIVVNAPNELTNASVKVVYIFYMKQNLEGVYKVNAKEVLNKKITKEVFKSLNLEKVATLQEVKRALK